MTGGLLNRAGRSLRIRLAAVLRRLAGALDAAAPGDDALARLRRRFPDAPEAWIALVAHRWPTRGDFRMRAAVGRAADPPATAQRPPSRPPAPPRDAHVSAAEVSKPGKAARADISGRDGRAAGRSSAGPAARPDRPARVLIRPQDREPSGTPSRPGPRAVATKPRLRFTDAAVPAASPVPKRLNPPADTPAPAQRPSRPAPRRGWPAPPPVQTAPTPSVDGNLSEVSRVVPEGAPPPAPGGEVSLPLRWPDIAPAQGSRRPCRPGAPPADQGPPPWPALPEACPDPAPQNAGDARFACLRPEQRERSWNA